MAYILKDVIGEASQKHRLSLLVEHQQVRHSTEQLLEERNCGESRFLICIKLSCILILKREGKGGKYKIYDGACFV